MSKIDVYNALRKNEQVPVYDNETKKQSVVSSEDFYLDRESGSNKYVHSADSAFFLDKESGDIISTESNSFYSFYDNANYQYLDSDILDTVLTDKDKLKTGETVRDFLPKGKFGTAVSNVSDALINNFTLGQANRSNNQTRQEYLAEQRLREEAGFVGGIGTTVGEVGGILGATLTTGGIGGIAAGAVGAIKVLPKVARTATAVSKYLRTGKGVLHTGAVGGAYSAPWAISTAINEKDVGKGVETMVWGAAIPFAAHGALKPLAKVGKAISDKVRQGYFQLPKKASQFAKVKDNLAVSATIEPNFLPDAIYQKIAQKLKPGTVDLSKGLTVTAKRELIKNASRSDVLDIYTHSLRQVRQATAGKAGIPLTKEAAFKDLEKFQEATGKSIGKLRDWSAKHPKVFSLKGSDVKTELKGVLPKGEFDKFIAKKQLGKARPGIEADKIWIKNEINTLGKMYNTKKLNVRNEINELGKTYKSERIKLRDELNKLLSQERVSRITPKEVPKLTKNQKLRKAELRDELNKLASDEGKKALVLKDKMNKLLSQENKESSALKTRLNQLVSKDKSSKVFAQSRLDKVSSGDDFLATADKSSIDDFNKLIDQIDDKKFYNLKDLKKLKDKFSDQAHFAMKTQPKFSENLFRHAYSTMTKMEEAAILGLEKKLRVAGLNPKDFPNLFKSISNFKRSKAQYATSAGLLNQIDIATGKSGSNFLTAERAAVYGASGALGLGYGGSPGAIGALMAASGVQKLGQKGLFLKPMEAMGNSVNSILNFGKTLTFGKPKELPALTISKIISSRIGNNGDDEPDDDLNSLAMGVASSLSEPHVATPGTDREFLDGLFSDLNVNTPERKLSLAQTFANLERTLLSNVSIMKKGDPAIEQKKKEFINNIEVLFSPDLLQKHIDQGTLTSKHVDNFRNTYPRLYGSMRHEIIMQNEREPLVKKVGYEKTLVLSKFVGEDLTGLGNYRQKAQPINDENKKPAKEHDSYQFDNVSADLRKEIYTSKNQLQKVENF